MQTLCQRSGLPPETCASFLNPLDAADVRNPRQVVALIELLLLQIEALARDTPHGA